MRILILGGTSEAKEIAQAIHQIPQTEVISSLAGRTRYPSEIIGNTRIGGFGGIDGLTKYLQENNIELLIDATHPFAAQISFNGWKATKQVGIPHIMLVRPAWIPIKGDRWIEVDTIPEAIPILLDLKPQLPSQLKVFLTIGRQEIATFAKLKDIWFLMRMIDPPQVNVPHGELLLAKGPFSVNDEYELLIKHRIEIIVSKNSGGDATYAKIIAARKLGLPIIMIKRPQLPDTQQVPDLKTLLAILKLT